MNPRSISTPLSVRLLFPNSVLRNTCCPRAGYNSVFLCTGWKFNPSLFAKGSRPEMQWYDEKGDRADPPAIDAGTKRNCILDFLAVFWCCHGSRFLTHTRSQTRRRTGRRLGGARNRASTHRWQAATNPCDCSVTFRCSLLFLPLILVYFYDFLPFLR